MSLRPKYLRVFSTHTHTHTCVRVSHNVHLKVTAELMHDDVSHVERPLLRHRGECLKSEYTEPSLFCSAYSRFALVNLQHTVRYFYEHDAVARLPCTLICHGCKATNDTYRFKTVRIVTNNKIEFN